MKVICMGCGILLRELPFKLSLRPRVSHGLCSSCAHHMHAQLGMSIGEYIERLPAPIVLVGEDGKINSANSLACKILNKSLPQICGKTGGEVLECKHAHLPQGCGRTEHCSGCAIRFLISDTQQTGQAHRRVAVQLQQYSSDADANSEIELLISTERHAELIFLTIEDAATVSAAEPDKA